MAKIPVPLDAAAETARDLALVYTKLNAITGMTPAEVAAMHSQATVEILEALTGKTKEELVRLYKEG